MAKFRILKLVDRYYVQQKRFLSGWDTKDYFAKLEEAYRYIALKDPYYEPNNDELIYETKL